MKKVKFLLRLFVAIFVGIPTIWIPFLAFTLFGLSILMIIGGFFGILASWMMSSESGINEYKGLISDCSYTLIAPFHFWYFFIKGKNPFVEMGI